MGAMKSIMCQVGNDFVIHSGSEEQSSQGCSLLADPIEHSFRGSDEGEEAKQFHLTQDNRFGHVGYSVKQSFLIFVPADKSVEECIKCMHPYTN